MAANRPGGFLRRRLSSLGRLSSRRRGPSRLRGLRRAPARDHLVGVHQPHVNRRPDRDAAPLDDPPVQVAEGLAHLGLRAHFPNDLGQLLDFPAELQRRGQEFRGRNPLAARVVAYPRLAEVAVACRLDVQRLAGPRQVLEHAAILGVSDLLVDP
jgi:hypothetical protein